MRIVNTSQLPWGLSDKVDYGYRKPPFILPHRGWQIFVWIQYFFCLMCQVVLGTFSVTFYCVTLFCCSFCSILIVSATVCHWTYARHHWLSRTNKSILFVLHWLDVSCFSPGSSAKTQSFALGGSDNCRGGDGHTLTACQRSAYCHHREPKFKWQF